MKTPHTSSPSNVLNILTTWTLMGGGYIVKGKKNLNKYPATPSSVIIAVIHFCLPPLLFDLDYVLSAGTYQGSSAVRDLRR